ncbi:MAG: fumarate hydratase [Nitrososphaerota archaeon]|nr:fumarate hydratase [Nitrososphaerota archaeon]
MKKLDLSSIIEDVSVNLLRLAVTRLPEDVKESLEQAYRRETSSIGREQLKAILENVRLAEERSLPICQDTGLISFYLRAGSKFNGLECVEGAIVRAVKRATEEIPLRPNAVDPLTEENSSDNVGRHIPHIHWRVEDGDFLEITAFPKGAGSENMSILKMLQPSEGLEGLKKLVIDAIIEAGGKPCPPTIVGVGFGGGSNIAMELAKLALLEPLNVPNPDEGARELERELCEAANMTGIGPMGLGGDVTVLAVKVKYAHRHPASYPVAIAFQCWAARRATARIYSNGEVNYLTHKI